MSSKRGRGRPPFPWTEDVEAEIFDRMIGGESVATICGVDRDNHLPSERAFYQRLTRDEDFLQRYMRAREAQAHQEADEIRKIADAATVEDYNVARLRVDARKWRASKLAPGKYGDRQTIDMNVSDADRDDKELVHELRQSAARLGVSADSLLKGMQIDE